MCSESCSFIWHPKVVTWYVNRIRTQPRTSGPYPDEPHTGSVPRPWTARQHPVSQGNRRSGRILRPSSTLHVNRENTGSTTVGGLIGGAKTDGGGSTLPVLAFEGSGGT